MAAKQFFTQAGVRIPRGYYLASNGEILSVGTPDPGTAGPAVTPPAATAMDLIRAHPYMAGGVVLAVIYFISKNKN